MIENQDFYTLVYIQALILKYHINFYFMSQTLTLIKMAHL